MNISGIVNRLLVAGLLALSLNVDRISAQVLPPGAPDAEGEVLTRGPVHEAFAETVTFDPEPGIVVPKAPPEAIEEMPPEQRPEGDNVAWIPGYVAWDDERSDFLWVSGIWRNLPPGRQWVPGYWSDTGQGYQWTSGYWADAAAAEVEYLPEPPATVEAGPNVAAPSANHIWTPGCWTWHQNRYAWRPGYWETAYPDWTWVPAHYVWAQRGYVFVDGYYDYSIDRRGLLFAPVYFNANVYSQRGFLYSPTTVINPAVFVSQLFLRPRYQHYYFGDYYAANYSRDGYYPWFSYNSSRYGYDPIYAQQRWNHRQNRDWERNVRADYEHRRDHEEARPPRTWAAQRAITARQANSVDKSFVIAAPLDQLARSKESPLRFQSVAREERQSLARHGQDIQKFRQERQKLEARTGGATAGQTRQSEPTRVKFSKSPIVAKSAREFGKDQAPPRNHAAPEPDLKFKPKPRDVARSSDKSREHTVNRRPADAELGLQPRSKPPGTGTGPSDAQRLPRGDQPKSPPPSQPRVDRQRQPAPRQPRGGQPAASPRVDRTAKPPQQTPRLDRTQAQLRGERLQTPSQPKVNRSTQPRVNQPSSQRQSGTPRSTTTQPRQKVARSPQRQPQQSIDRSQTQPRGDRASTPPRGNSEPRSRGPSDSSSGRSRSGGQEPQGDEKGNKGKGRQ